MTLMQHFHFNSLKCEHKGKMKTVKNDQTEK